MAAGRKALDLMPVSREAWRATYRVEDMARIYTMLGEYDQAIAQLDFVLSMPSEVSVAGLSSDPAWASLRERPAFRAMVNRHAK